MTPLFKKLNLKNQNTIIIVNHPDSFNNEINDMKMYANFEFEIKNKVSFGLFFVTQLSEIENFASKLSDKLSDETVLWFCYPKGSSKKYKCEFNRDNGWTSIHALNYEAVRMVAIDEDWSALRFKPVNKIKYMTRSVDFAKTEAGKLKTKPLD